jgi:hypothetical protein
MIEIVDVAVDPDLDGFKYEFPVNVNEVSAIIDQMHRHGIHKLVGKQAAKVMFNVFITLACSPIHEDALMPATDRYQRAFDGVNDLVKSIHLQSDTVGRILAYFHGGKLSEIFLEYIQTQLSNEPTVSELNEFENN